MTRQRLSYLAALLVGTLLALGVWLAPEALAAESDFEQMNADLVPIHLELRDAVARLSDNVTIMGSHQATFQLNALMEDIRLTQKAMDDVQAAAEKGMDVLSSVAPEPCFAEYWAGEYTMFTLMYDGIDSLRAGDLTQANPQLSAALYLFNVRLDLLFENTTCGVGA